MCSPDPILFVDEDSVTIQNHSEYISALAEILFEQDFSLLLQTFNDLKTGNILPFYQKRYYIAFPSEKHILLLKVFSLLFLYNS